MTSSRSLPYFALAALLAAAAHAQDPSTVSSAPATDDPNSYDVDIGVGFTNGTEVQIGSLQPGELGTSEFTVGAGLTLPAGENWAIRYGLLFQARKFETSGRVPFAQGKGLHVLALDLRASRALGERTTLIVGVRPGSYGQEYAFADDFSCPGMVTLVYRTSDTLTFIGGARYNEHGESPVLPVAGVRWNPTPSFRVQLVFPRTSVEFDWSDRTTLFLTGHFEETVYRVDDARLRNFDERRNQVRDRLQDRFPDQELPPILTSEEFDYPTLVNTEARYRDVQLGAGVTWRLGEHWRFEVEGGFSPERSLDFNHAGVRIDLGGNPGYFRFGFSGDF